MSTATVDAPRVIVLGLDGGTWAVLKPLMETGRLENLGDILSKSTHADLKSIIPPVTGPAWPAMATGLNPGRLGAFDFYNRQNLDNYDLYPVRSHVVRGRAFWDALSEKGYRVGIFNYPMLTPPYEINGWMVAGLGASKIQEWTWPHSLARELDSMAHPYSISISYGLPKYRNNYEKLLDDLEKMVTGRLAALAYLLEHYPVDVLVAVFSATDVLLHTMWHLWDSAHPMYDDQLSSEILPRVYALWAKLDAGINALLQRLASPGHLLVVSDHGFGSNFGVFHINVWLEQNGYLKRRGVASRLNNRLRASLVSTFSPMLKLLKPIQGTRAHFALRESVLREIDLSQTKAFALESTDVCGMIFVNREYARERGLSETEFVDEIVTEIRERLLGFSQETELDIEIFLPGELYAGELSHLAPELLFKVNDFAVSVSYRFASTVCERRLHQPMKTGTHRQAGIFLAYGDKMRRGVEISPVNILDIAPTIYHVLDEPAPTNLDGQVAIESFLPAHRRVAKTSGSEKAWTPADTEGYTSAKEMEEMKQRLRDLGYID